MRTAITVSALAHAVFCALNALSTPAPIAAPAESAVTVDIVSPEEVGETAKAPAPAPANSREPLESGAKQSEAASGNSPPTQPPHRPAPTEQTKRSEQGVPPKSKAAPARMAAATAQAVADPAASASTGGPAAQQAPQNEPKPELSQFGSSWLDAALSSLPVTTTHYDESESAANLSPKDIATFKAHLQKCWSPPAGLAEDGQLMAVLRVALKPNGALAGEPTMLAASASSNGPALLQTAIRALRQCQPYSFLPAAKYKEWKVLDLSFSPGGLSTRPPLVSGFDNH